MTPDGFCHPKENVLFPATKLALEVGELAVGKKMEVGKNMDSWGLPKEWKWDYYRKNRDKYHNASQENVTRGGGRLGHENRRDYRGGQSSGGRFGVTTRSNSAFCFGGAPSSGGGFGNTNQYQDGGNGTGNQGFSDGDLSHVHHTIFKMIEPHYKKSKGTIHLKHLMEAGGLDHNNETLPWLKNHLEKQQKNDFLAQYARILLKTKVHVRPCPKPEKIGKFMDQKCMRCVL